MKQLYAKYMNNGNGRDCEVEEAQELFVAYQYYPVEKVDMGQSHTSITLKGFSGSFNSVLFDFYFYEDGIWKAHDIFADPDYNPYLERKIYRFKGADGKDRIFKVNDAVITASGRLGRIKHFCTCINCNVRGFLEPLVEYLDIDDSYGSDYISNYEYSNNFEGYYKIGNDIFGEKPKEEDIKSIIENHTETIERLQNNVKEYKRLLEFLYPVEK